MAEYGIRRKFERSYPYANRLETCEVYAKLKEMMSAGEVFAAIRENCVDFYYKGQRVARRGMRKYQTNFLDNSFETDVENLSAIFNKIDKCPEGEGAQLSKLFHHFSWFNHTQGMTQPILLDMEARFASLEENGEFDKIDLVFLHPKQKALLFVEGKRQRDSRVRSSSGVEEPHVLSQIKRYENQLVAREKDDNQIKEAYKKTIEQINNSGVFGVDLPLPEVVLPKVPILIFGEYDSEKDIKAEAKINDVWLEPELKKISRSGGVLGSIECNYLRGGKALLIDGREIFRNHNTQMTLLGDALNALTNDIVSNA